MDNNHPLRTHKWRLPEPDPEEVDAAARDATVDVVLNVYQERNNAKSIALRISFRLPETA